jgi:hypothetical protein
MPLCSPREARSTGTLVVALCLAALSSLSTTRVLGQLPVGNAALPGGSHVASAAHASWIGAQASAGYAYTEPLASSDASHHRGTGALSLSFTPLEALSLAASGELRADGHRLDGARRDYGLALGSAIHARARHALSDALDLALDLALGFPPAKGFRRGLASTSPALVAIATHRPTRRFSWSSNLGFRLDRSQNAVADPDGLSSDDRVSAALSESHQLLFGVLATSPLFGFTWTAELSADLQLGRRAPPALASPLRVELGAQRELDHGLWLGATLGASPSSRPDGSELARIEPRTWALVRVGYTWDQRTAHNPTPSAASWRPSVTRHLDISLTTPEGKPAADAKLTLIEGQQQREYSSDAEGRARLELTSNGPATLRIEAPGYVPQTLDLNANDASPQLSLELEAKLPEGQIRGRVRDLAGRPLRAQIEVSPLSLTLSTDDDGAFTLDVPPGDYSVRVVARGYEAQVRPALVEKDGVTILVVDLRRERGRR